MNNLFKKWGEKIPKYSGEFKDLFNRLSQKYGAEGDKKVSLGKHFSTNYELYIYAYFLGLYNNEFVPDKGETKKAGFNHHIQFWGSKSNLGRKDFTKLQEYIFISLIAKTDVDLIELEKGNISEEEVVKQLLETMEGYTNGGLTLIKEKSEDNPTYFLQSTSLMNMIIKNTKVNVEN